MKIKKLDLVESPNDVESHIDCDEFSEKAPAPTPKEFFVWAEFQRTLYAAGELPAAHVKALMTLPGWSWERTKFQGLADACWFFVQHDDLMRYLASISMG